LFNVVPFTLLFGDGTGATALKEESAAHLIWQLLWSVILDKEFLATPQAVGPFIENAFAGTNHYRVLAAIRASKQPFPKCWYGVLG
jgi:hypothetical protein